VSEEYESHLPVLDGKRHAITEAYPSGFTCEGTFHRDFSEPVSSDIEMRLCSGTQQYDEEITIGNVEVYVF